MRKILIRFEGPHQEPYRIYWSPSHELASPRRFATLAEAAPFARALMEEWNIDQNIERTN